MWLNQIPRKPGWFSAAIIVVAQQIKSALTAKNDHYNVWAVFAALPFVFVECLNVIEWVCVLYRLMNLNDNEMHRLKHQRETAHIKIWPFDICIEKNRYYGYRFECCIWFDLCCVSMCVCAHRFDSQAYNKRKASDVHCMIFVVQNQWPLHWKIEEIMWFHQQDIVCYFNMSCLVLSCQVFWLCLSSFVVVSCLSARFIFKITRLIEKCKNMKLRWENIDRYVSAAQCLCVCIQNISSDRIAYFLHTHTLPNMLFIIISFWHASLLLFAVNCPNINSIYVVCIAYKLY